MLIVNAWELVGFQEAERKEWGRAIELGDRNANDLEVH